jgi:hypothetical protein
LSGENTAADRRRSSSRLESAIVVTPANEIKMIQNTLRAVPWSFPLTFPHVAISVITETAEMTATTAPMSQESLRPTCSRPTITNTAAVSARTGSSQRTIIIGL